MTKEKDDNKMKTPEFRVRFASVFNKRAMRDEDGNIDESKAAKYSITMIFPEKTNLTRLKRMARGVAEKEFGKAKRGVRYDPFRENEEKEDLEGFEEPGEFASASTQFKPGIINTYGEDLTDQEEFYDGCYARATVHCYPYNKKGNKGVAFGLNSILKTEDGDKIEQGGSARSDFEDDIDEDGGSNGGGDGDDSFLD